MAAKTYTVELHCHTYHSSDSLMLPEQILKVCDARGIDRIAITDHNTIAGAQETAALAPERVIIGEEILTTEGEILGYFMSDEIPKGLPPMEVVQRLKDQGALISVSHPFDPTRGCRWSIETLEPLLPHLDMIEILNARTWTDQPNLEAAELAKRIGLPGAAGSDAHAPLEVGRATIVMPAFNDVESFRQGLQEAYIQGRRSNPLVHLTSRYAVWRKSCGWKRPGSSIEIS
jgi:predicted metal-dependent phosphoesterase TrpH